MLRGGLPLGKFLCAMMLLILSTQPKIWMTISKEVCSNISGGVSKGNGVLPTVLPLLYIY